MKLSVSGGAFILLSAMVLLLPLQWVVAVILAAVVHEIFHAVAIYLTGGDIQAINIGGRGVTIYTQPMSGIQEMICAIAGPIGSFSLLILARWLPRTAICGLVHGFYNLMPLLPLDGGRVLRGVLQAILPPPMANRILRRLQQCFRIMLILACALFVSRLGIFAVGLGIFLLAKKSFWRYNRSIIDKGERL